MRIFIHRGKQTLGPYSSEQVKQELATGNLSPSDVASYDGYDGNKVSVLQVPGVGSVPKAKFRMGCCGWMVVAALFTAIVIGLASLTEENKLSISNGVASITINDEDYVSGNLDDYQMVLDLIIRRIAGTVWDEARKHPEVHAIVVHLNVTFPEHDHKDRYGNETHTDSRRVHLCDIDIDDLVTVRRYQDENSYALHDEDVLRAYRQQIDPSFKQYFMHIYHSDY